MFGIDSVQFIQVRLTKISCIRTSFEIRFMHDFDLFRVRFRQVSLYDIVLFEIVFFLIILDHKFTFIMEKSIMKGLKIPKM